MLSIKPLALFTISLLGFASLLAAPSAQAQFRVSPLVIEEKSERGQAQGVIEIANPGDTATQVRIYASPFTYDESGFVELDSHAFDLSPYLFFSPKEVTMEPGQIRRIRLSARLFPSLPDGEYRAVIFVRSETPNIEERDGFQINIVPRIGVLFFVQRSHN